MKIHENFKLINHNTFGVDASSKYFIKIKSEAELNAVFKLKQFEETEILILGGGSNILFTQNFNGLVIKNEIKGKKVISETNSFVNLKIGAGENWHKLVMYCVDNEWGGIENLSLIPGNSGTAPMQNIGAYGVEIKDTFVELEAFEIASGKIVKFSKSDCKFGYRESIFKNEKKNQFIILNITLKLHKNPKVNIGYGDVIKVLESQNIKKPNIKDVSKAIIHIRNSKLPNPKEIGNCGSFFKNPVIDQRKLEEIKKNYPEIIYYPVSKTHVKIAAGWLIDKAGWKGKTFGNYGVHKKQALVLVNYGNAEGQELYELSEKIIIDIQNKFKITLEREVNII